MPATINLKQIAAAALLVLCLSFSTKTFAQDGSPDPKFGKNGYAITSVGGVAANGYSVVQQTDGKLILGGVTTVNSSQSFALVRYWPNGKVDSSFGVNGRVIAGLDPATTISLTTVKLQQDGKIVAAGHTESNDFVLLRFKTDGSVDSTFGTNGRVHTVFGTSSLGSNAMDLQSNGYIVVAGTRGLDIAVVRYKTDGSLDETFGTAGIKIIDLGGGESANAVLVQPGGKILIGGGSQSGAVIQLLLLRCKSNGDLDSTFGTNGKTMLLPRQSYNPVYALALQPDGKIVAAGRAQYFQSAYCIVRFSADGVPDSSFGTNGIVVHQFANTGEEARAVVVQADGKIVAGGNVNDAGSLQIGLLRLKKDGSVDSTFEYDGEVRTSQDNGTFCYSMLIQPDNKIVTGGYDYSSTKGNRFAVLRFNVSNILPVSLNSFTATAVKNTTLLNWSTASEVNSSYFTIERSSGSSGYSAIGNVNSHGNSNQLQQYQFTDASPLTGDNFYRLKQVDKDGRYSYSKMVHVAFGKQPFIQAYPNPTRGMVKIGGLNNANATLTVVDASGKTLHQYRSTGNDYTINIQSLTAGIYFVRVQQGEKVTTLKLVKQ